MPKAKARPVQVATPTIPMQQFREQLTEVIGEVQYAKKPVIITSHRRQAVAVIPAEHLALLEEALERLADVEAGAQAMKALNDTSDEVTTYLPGRLRRT